MESAREHYERVMLEMPELEAELERIKSEKLREESQSGRFYIRDVKYAGQLDSKLDDFVFYPRSTSNDPGYFISVEAQLTKYANVPKPMSEDKKPDSH